jgi:AcrR family transcriptional regulator
VWLRPERPARDRRLSRDAIVTAAIGILDTEGIRGLSMRRIADSLGVTAGSLYWHMATKDELLELAADQVTGEIELPGSGTGGDGGTGGARGWRAAITAIAHGQRAMLLRHPWVIQMGAQPNMGPNALRTADRMLRILADAGFDPDLASAALNAMGNQVVGAVTAEMAWQQVTSGPAGTLADWQRDAAGYLEMVRERYPMVAARLTAAPAGDIGKVSEERFSLALDCLLDGLQARANPQQAESLLRRRYPYLRTAGWIRRRNDGACR